MVMSLLRRSSRRLFLTALVVLGPLLGAAALHSQAAEPAAGPLPLAVVLPKVACADLMRVDVAAIGGAGSRVTAAAVAQGVQGKPVCAVEGNLAPTIGFRVELPLQNWTQRYLQTGCGGLCGSLNIRIGAGDGCSIAQAGGFVVASTDMGHRGPDGAFGQDPQKRADFAYRGVHLTALAAKALIRAFYGQAERFSYFSGCSDGGREALVEAQRFAGDFNGIVAGAPAMNFQVQNSLFHGWQARSNTGADGKPILVAARLPILHTAVLRACDAADGLADGLVAEPGQCRFDPASTACGAGQDPATCLTAAEIEVARHFYAGPRDSRTDERLTPGGPQYGSELQWVGVYVPREAGQGIFSARIVNDAVGNLIFPDGRPATVEALTFDRATFDRLRARHPFYDSTNPDLSAFAARGGKLILFHGWADPHISPLNTIAYHDAVRRQMGARADGFERMYLMPGMGHCSGGEGPSAFDLLTPVMAWVESGIAPDAIMTRTPERTTLFGSPGDSPRPPSAGRPAGGPGAAPIEPPPGAAPPAPAGPSRSRPVYPYPYVAAYVGRGDPNAAANWTRGKAAPVAVPAWAGADFFRPYVGVTG